MFFPKSQNWDETIASNAKIAPLYLFEFQHLGDADQLLLILLEVEIGRKLVEVNEPNDLLRHGFGPLDPLRVFPGRIETEEAFEEGRRAALDNHRVDFLAEGRPADTELQLIFLKQK